MADRAFSCHPEAQMLLFLRKKGWGLLREDVWTRCREPKCMEGLLVCHLTQLHANYSMTITLSPGSHGWSHFGVRCQRTQPKLLLQRPWLLEKSGWRGAEDKRNTSHVFSDRCTQSFFFSSLRWWVDWWIHGKAGNRQLCCETFASITAYPRWCAHALCLYAAGYHLMHPTRCSIQWWWLWRTLEVDERFWTGAGLRKIEQKRKSSYSAEDHTSSHLCFEVQVIWVEDFGLIELPNTPRVWNTRAA